METQERMARMQNWLRDGRMPDSSRRWARFEVARLQYHLDRGINPDAVSGPLFARGFANASSYLLLPLLAIVFASDIVSAEFAQGTIKLLLTRPVGRAWVLASKLAALMLSITLTVLLGGIVAYAFGGLAYGYGGWGAPVLTGFRAGRRVLRSFRGACDRALEGRDPGVRPRVVRGGMRRRHRAPELRAPALDRRRDGDDARGSDRRDDPAAAGLFVGGAEISVRDEPAPARLLFGVSAADPGLTVGFAVAVLAVWAAAAVAVAFFVFVRRDVLA